MPLLTPSHLHPWLHLCKTLFSCIILSGLSSAFISESEGLLSHHAPRQVVLFLPFSGKGQRPKYWLWEPKGKHQQPHFWWSQCCAYSECNPCGLVLSAPVDQMMWPPSQLLENDGRRINIRKGSWQEKGTTSLKWECIILQREHQEG